MIENWKSQMSLKPKTEDRKLKSDYSRTSSLRK